MFKRHCLFNGKFIAAPMFSPQIAQKNSRWRIIFLTLIISIISNSGGRDHKTKHSRSWVNYNQVGVISQPNICDWQCFGGIYDLLKHFPIIGYLQPKEYEDSSWELVLKASVETKTHTSLKLGGSSVFYLCYEKNSNFCDAIKCHWLLDR